MFRAREAGNRSSPRQCPDRVGMMQGRSLAEEFTLLLGTAENSL